MPSHSPLFRRQALDAKKQQLTGDVLIARRLTFSLLAALAVLVAVALIAFACTAEYTRKSKVSGFLVPDKGLLKIYPPETGTVIEKPLTEGQPVTRGDTLFVLSTERGSKETPRAQAAVIKKLTERRKKLESELSQQAHIDDLEGRALAQKILRMKRELGQLDREISSQRVRVASSRKTAKRFGDLHTKAFASEMTVQQTKDDLVEQQIKLQGMERTRMRLERDIEGLKLEGSSIELRAGKRRSETEREIAALEQELTEYEARRNIVVVAPADGTVTTILAEPGQRAEPGSPLVSVLPTGAVLQAQLLVPSRSIGFVTTGQSVAIRYQAFPYQRFGSYRGHVASISKSIILPGDADLPVELTEPVYRATVELDRQSVEAYRKAIPLQAGMLLDADIWLDRRRVIEWVLEPLYSLKGRL